jgi:uncharacterized protein involved in type VI secretion and phage assembly
MGGGTLANVDVPIIKINGAPLSTEHSGKLLELLVDSSLDVPDMLTLRFEDADLTLVNDSTFALGAEIKIEIQPSGTTAPKPLIDKALISAIEPDFQADGSSTLLVRAYAQSNKLHFDRKTRTFLKQTDSDIVKKLATEAGMSAVVDNTVVMHDYILQYNQTDMEFLSTRAERIGYQVYTDGATLYFKKPDAVRATGPELKLGDNLTSFRPRLTIAQQVGTVTARGWDVRKKKEIVEEGASPTATNQGGTGKTGAAHLQTVNGSAKTALILGALQNASDAKAVADGVAMNANREVIDAEGVCSGTPEIKAGVKIKIGNVGTRFSGAYFVTTATHVYTRDGYSTSFTISGRQPNTASRLLEGQAGQAHDGRIHDVVVGIVTNNKDPDGLGRVKVKLPWMPEGNSIESDWARIATPMAGKSMGLMILPEIDDEVLVAFEHGDTARAYVVGALWNGKDKPPLATDVAVKSGTVAQRILKTRTGHQVIFDDSSDKASITIIDKTGENKLFFDSMSGDVELKSKANMKIDVGGNLTMSAKGNIDIKATGNLSAKATGSGAIESTGPMSVKTNASLGLQAAASAELKANAMLSVSSSGMTEVKGSLVKIN